MIVLKVLGCVGAFVVGSLVGRWVYGRGRTYGYERGYEDGLIFGIRTVTTRMVPLLQAYGVTREAVAEVMDSVRN